MHPSDMERLTLRPGDLVEVQNEAGLTQAMAYPTDTVRIRETFMLFGNPGGVQGNVVSAATNDLHIPNYKQTWANIRKLADGGVKTASVSFKSKEYVVS